MKTNFMDPLSDRNFKHLYLFSLWFDLSKSYQYHAFGDSAGVMCMCGGGGGGGGRGVRGRCGGFLDDIYAFPENHPTTLVTV